MVVKQINKKYYLFTRHSLIYNSSNYKTNVLIVCIKLITAFTTNYDCHMRVRLVLNKLILFTLLNHIKCHIQDTKQRNGTLAHMYLHSAVQDSENNPVDEQNRVQDVANLRLHQTQRIFNQEQKKIDILCYS